MKKIQTCYELFVEICENQNLALYFYDHRIKLSSILKDVDNFAAHLQELGFLPGDVLSINLPTCPQALVAFYACSKIGVIANFVNPVFPINKLLENLKSTNSKGIIYYDMLLKNNEQLDNSNQILIKCSTKDYVGFRKPIFALYSMLKSKNIKRSINYSRMVKKAQKQAKITPNKTDTVCMMHSGGTTGTPKTIKLQNSAFIELAYAINNTKYRKLTKEELALTVLPICHSYGLGIAMQSFLYSGYSLYLVPQFNPELCNKIIKKYNVTLIAGVPVIYEKLMNEKHFEGKHLAKLNRLHSGGDFANEKFVTKFEGILKKYNSNAKLLICYGLTETCSTGSVSWEKCYKAKSCGKPMSNTTIEIWDDNNEILGHDKIGNIVIKSTSLMEGYLGEESGLTYKNGEKYVISGDLGYLDKDGFLFVVDRKKRSTKIAGYNVFPSEIEQVVKTIDFVEDAFAKTYTDENKTYIKLFVSVNVKLDQEFVKSKILEVCKKNLSKYSIPKTIIILEKMPKTNLGKLDLNILNNM